MLGEERETEGNFLSQFIGLAFRNKRNPVKEKKGGKLEKKERERRKGLFSFPLSGLLSGEKTTDFD